MSDGYSVRWLENNDAPHGTEMLVRAEDELFIDHDGPGLPENFYYRLERFSRAARMKVKGIQTYKSRSGVNNHIIVKLGRSVSDEEAAVYQTVLGSDIFRETMAMQRINAGIYPVIVLYKPLRSEMVEVPLRPSI